jgi:hypothetical protein
VGNNSRNSAKVRRLRPGSRGTSLRSSGAGGSATQARPRRSLQRQYRMSFPDMLRFFATVSSPSIRTSSRSGPCQTTSSPSAVTWTSISNTSASAISIAWRKARSVLWGTSPTPPRCARSKGVGNRKIGSSRRSPILPARRVRELLAPVGQCHQGYDMIHPPQSFSPIRSRLPPADWQTGVAMASVAASAKRRAPLARARAATSEVGGRSEPPFGGPDRVLKATAVAYRVLRRLRAAADRSLRPSARIPRFNAPTGVAILRHLSRSCRAISALLSAEIVIKG